MQQNSIHYEKHLLLYASKMLLGFINFNMIGIIVSLIVKIVNQLKYMLYL